MTNRIKPGLGVGPTWKEVFDSWAAPQSIDRALLYSAQVHAGDVRKGTQIPYLSHLLSVAALVMEDGGAETEIIAALLHDTAEDHGGEERLSDIEQKFGREVADIVRACSDSLKPEGVDKDDWAARKGAYLARLPEEPVPVLRVSLADKLHNARCILGDYRQIGDQLWGRFTGGKEGTLSYYRDLLNIFDSVEHRPSPYRSSMVGELMRVIGDLDGLLTANEAAGEHRLDG